MEMLQTSMPITTAAAAALAVLEVVVAALMALPQTARLLGHAHHR
jgi:hypothetical protein